MAGIVTCKVGAKMCLSTGFGRTRQPRYTRRLKATRLVGGPLAGQFYGYTPGINSTVAICMQGQAGAYIKGLWKSTKEIT